MALRIALQAPGRRGGQVLPNRLKELPRKFRHIGASDKNTSAIAEVTVSEKGSGWRSGEEPCF
eukprot:CAMPEP_0180821570 /NCGR_PEP_ID=MMETSP1038_2-20121128/70898_1 /TAXON_ID=632150 /ORGANISM="Azadinium spinosum, Strain 3D9" /LENGTH=62 /DNA_ID=CAMNT_0022863755 /DNA_START=18 /DNA_END=207 /DNA_ORIENTATION=+